MTPPPPYQMVTDVQESHALSATQVQELGRWLSSCMNEKRQSSNGGSNQHKPPPSPQMHNYQEEPHYQPVAPQPQQQS